jgi:hypothetical protein
MYVEQAVGGKAVSEDKGTYICYAPKNFQAKSLDTIGKALKIIAEYESMGYSLTLRQLYYQMVARGLLPENTKEQYERLGGLINDGRMAGLISWTAIEDRGRNLMGLETQTDIKPCIKKVRADYRRDLWEGQPCRPEVWVEKQALEGVIGQVCNRLRVDFFATKGYNSQSEQWRAGMRFASMIQKGQRPIVFHVADHDPAGIDMTRDNYQRLSLFVGSPITVIRLALNMEQVERFNPPPNFAKETDSKTPAYVAEYGEECWEVDALDPRYIHEIIADAVGKFRDDGKWSEALAKEAEDLNELDTMIEEL